MAKVLFYLTPDYNWGEGETGGGVVGWGGGVESVPI